MGACREFQQERWRSVVTMIERFAKPVRMAHDRLEGSAALDPAESLMNPAERSAVAHSTAQMLVEGMRKGGTEEQVERLVAFAQENGLDTLAELWSGAQPVSLPGALWRLYLLKAALADNVEDARLVFERGIEVLGTIDEVVAGAPDPLASGAFLQVIDDILRGAFTGDFSLTLERASSIARAVSAGVISLSTQNEHAARSFVDTSLRWSIIADVLSTCAKRAAVGQLS
jgi:hypothetical protein